MNGFSEYTQSALTILRKPQLTMHWYIVPIFVITLYCINKEIAQKNYKNRNNIPMHCQLRFS